MRKLSMNELGRKSKAEIQKIQKAPICIVLDNIRSMNNVGSVFRTSDAFLIEKLYLCGITAQPPHREIYKSALGAEETVSWIYKKTTFDAIEELKKNGYTIVGLEQTDQSVDLKKFEFLLSKKYALIFGNEVNGISDDVLSLLDYAVEIPQFGSKHSFNISVSVGIVLWDYFVKNNL
ncbi:MAG: RNA methyltransferase [Bacteroidota bacterium]|nr:RNA methyltransferase [Bacteroidota bacterium]